MSRFRILVLATAVLAGLSLASGCGDGATEPPTLAHGALADQPGHKVDGVAPVLKILTVGIGTETKVGDNGVIYEAGDHIPLITLFTEDVVVEGSPSIEMIVGDTTRQAAYHGPVKVLGVLNGQEFRYPVVAADLDKNGIAVPADPVRLNGGKIRDAAGNQAVLNHAGFPDDKGHVVYGVEVTTAVDLPKGPVGGSFDATITFSHAVTGFEKSDITVEGGSVTALGAIDARTYVATIKAAAPGDVTVSVPAGVAQYTSNTGNGNQASEPETVRVVTMPTVSAVSFASAPASGQHDTYKKGDEITVQVVFDHAMAVTGAPTVDVRIGDTIKQAAYTGGGGTTTLTFTYTVAAGDEDTDGAGIVRNGLKLNDGTIRKIESNVEAELGHAAKADQPGHKVDGVAPVLKILTVGIGTETKVGDNGVIYEAGDHIPLITLFTEDVVVEGSSSIEMIVGDTTRQAAYHGPVKVLGVLNGQEFRYPVVAADLDKNGIAVPADPVRLNGGKIRDAAGNQAVLNHAGFPDDKGHVVYGVEVTTAVDLPKGPVGGSFDATITFSHAVTGFEKSDITVEGGSVTALGAIDARTYVATIKAAAPGDVTVSVPAGVAQYTSNTGNGNQASEPETVRVVTMPTVSAVSFASAPASGQHDTYKKGDEITVQVVFDHAMAVTGAPTVDVRIGDTIKQAAYTGGGGTTTLTFTYTVAAGDEDTDGAGIVRNGLKLNDGTIRKIESNVEAELGHAAKADQPGHKVDGVAPATVRPHLSMDQAPDSTHAAGDEFIWILLFSEAVNVEGAPYLEFSVGSKTRSAAHMADRTSLSPNEDLLEIQGFGYTIAADDFDPDGLELEANSVRLNGGKIRDMAGNDAVLDHEGTGRYDHHRILGTKVTTTVAVPKGPVGGSFDATITFSHAVTGFEKSDITVEGGSVTALGAIDARTYVATIKAAAPGDVTVSVPAGVAQYTSNTGNGNQASERYTVIVLDPDPLTGFVLFDNANGGAEDVQALSDGATLEALTSDRLNVRAEVEAGAAVGSVYMELSGTLTSARTENLVPYALFGDKGGQAFPAGEYRLRATAYPESDLGGTALQTLEVAFTVAAAEPEVSIAPGTSPVSEGTAAAFTLSRTGATTQALTVDLSVTETRAMLGGSLPSTVTFGPGEREQSLSVATAGDSVVEPASTVTAAVVGGAGYRVAPGAGSADVTVEDDDAAVFTLLVDPAAIAEGEASAVTVAITNGATFALDQTIALSVTSGTAAKGTDYTIAPESLTLPAGQGSAAATITAVDDADEESAETIVVAATHHGRDIGTATVTISASDAPSNPLTGFVLFDNANGGAEDVQALSDGATLEALISDRLNVRAEVEAGAAVGSVYMELSGTLTSARTENLVPYALFGDKGGQAFPAGEYRLRATAYPESDLGGTALQTLEVAFTVAAK
ncbi:Ig-like domain-containing protein [Candidatus Palauibacter sp.]|uniref:Ig-like domain-containing protein n=1 Tax=Candidatus Palauibacter sp. TaxID=3101350 RepID=UPI003B5BB3C8